MAVPARAPMPPGWNGVNSSGGGNNNSSGTAGAPGGSFVWSDSTLKFGVFDTGIHTRVLKDIAVVSVSVALLITGLILIAKPDLTQFAKSATALLPEVAA